MWGHILFRLKCDNTNNIIDCLGGGVIMVATNNFGSQLTT